MIFFLTFVNVNQLSISRWYRNSNYIFLVDFPLRKEQVILAQFCIKPIRQSDCSAVRWDSVSSLLLPGDWDWWCGRWQPTQTRNVLEVDEQEGREEQGQGEGLSSRAAEVVWDRVHVIPCSGFHQIVALIRERKTLTWGLGCDVIVAILVLAAILSPSLRSSPFCKICVLVVSWNIK